MKHANMTLPRWRDIVIAVVLALPAFAASPAGAEGQTHTEAYQDSLARLESGQAEIEREMRRIYTGDVAHFDFLQFEHSEVLRHASALRHPPSLLRPEQRPALVEQAERVLKAAESLEWPIADFLRGHALVDSAVSNTIDIADLAARDSGNATRAVLQQLTAAALAFQADPSPVNLQTLTTAFAAVTPDTTPGEQPWRKELAVQQQLLASGTKSSAAALAAVETASLANEVESLVQLARLANGS